jgi:hypothetical protein
MTTKNARPKAMGLPAARAVHFAKRLKNEDDLPGLIRSSAPPDVAYTFLSLQSPKLQ